MGPIEEALREKFFPALFGGKEINANFQKILGRSVKHGGLGIPDPRFSAESAYNTSKAASGELIDSILGGSALNYVGHMPSIILHALPIYIFRALYAQNDGSGSRSSGTYPFIFCSGNSVGCVSGGGSLHAVCTVLLKEIFTGAAPRAARVLKDPTMVNWKVTRRLIPIDMKIVGVSPRSTTQVLTGTGTSAPPINIRSQDIGSPRGSIGPQKVRNAHPFKTFIHCFFPNMGNLIPFLVM